MPKNTHTPHTTRENGLGGLLLGSADHVQDKTQAQLR